MYFLSNNVVFFYIIENVYNIFKKIKYQKKNCFFLSVGEGKIPFRFDNYGLQLTPLDTPMTIRQKIIHLSILVYVYLNGKFIWNGK